MVSGWSAVDDGHIPLVVALAGRLLPHVGHRVGDVVRAASSAKAVAGDAAWKNARACIQIHGGMGFTWEIPAHYYLKRTWVLESVFGDVDEHADALADGIARAVA